MELPENGSEPGKIFVFNKRFFGVSETFIFRQIELLARDFDLTLIGFELRIQSFFNGKTYPFRQIDNGKSFFRGLLSVFFRKVLNKHLSNRSRIYKSLDAIIGSTSGIVIHAHYGWNGVMILPYARLHGIPLVVSFHGADASQWLSRPDYRSGLTDLFNYASAVILCSSHMVEKLALQEHAEKVRIIPYGINTTEFQLGSKQPSALQDLIVLHAGRLVSKKGVPDLIRVFSLLIPDRKVKLQIVGDGPQRLECEQLVEDLGIKEHVQFFGAQPLTKVKELMSGCDIFVLNSRTDSTGDMEGLPNAILEAMSFSKPVVSTRHAGIPMAIVHEESGLLVDENDNEQLAASMALLLDNPGLREKLGFAARERVKLHFEADKAGAALRKVFNEVFRTLEKLHV